MNSYTSKIKPGIILLGMLILLTGCGQKVARVDSDTVTDLSGNWNDTDSRLVAEEMIQDVLSRGWLTKFNRNKGKTQRLLLVRCVILATSISIPEPLLLTWSVR